MVLARVVPLPGALRRRELEDHEVHRLAGALEDFQLAPDDARSPVVLRNRGACLARVGLECRGVGDLLDVGDDVRCHGYLLFVDRWMKSRPRTRSARLGHCPALASSVSASAIFSDAQDHSTEMTPSEITT